MKAHPRLLVTSAGLAAIVAVLFTRTTGIHFDELNYMILAHYQPTGDAVRTGKPYAFYLLNYAVLHSVPAWTGGLRPVSLHLFYATISVCSLGWLAARATETIGQFVWLFAALLWAPFFVFNSTQVMMETAVLPMLTLTVAAAIDLDRHGPGRQATVLLFVAATLAILFKETAAAAVIIVFAAFWPRLGRRLWPLALALVVGFGMQQAMVAAVHAPPSENYGGVSTLLDVNALTLHAKLTGQYLSMWMFYVWPVTLLAVGVLYARGLFRDPYERTLLSLGAFSLVATIGIQLASNFALARYAYPSVWLGVIAFALLLMRGPRWLAALSIALYVFPIANMWRADPFRFSLWPPLVANEAHYSSYAILPGVPNLGWLAFAGNRRENMCILLARERAVGPEWLQRYFERVTVAPRFFDESQIADFSRCEGPKAILRKQHQETYACGPECPKGLFSERACSATEIRFISPGQMLTNLTCLP
jgi:hypothetical protein